MNEKTEQIKALIADEAFVKQALEAENAEAVQKLFADKGAEVSLEDIELIAALFGAAADGKITEEQLEKIANGGELSEDDLNEVAGGGIPIEVWPDGQRVISPKAFGVGVAGLVVSGLLIAGGTTYGICKACGVDLGDKISSAASWVGDKITSRW